VCFEQALCLPLSKRWKLSLEAAKISGSCRSFFFLSTLQPRRIIRNTCGPVRKADLSKECRFQQSVNRASCARECCVFQLRSRGDFNDDIKVRNVFYNRSRVSSIFYLWIKALLTLLMLLMLLTFIIKLSSFVYTTHTTWIFLAHA